MKATKSSAAERLSANADSRSQFPRARLFVGLLLVALVGAGVAFGLSRLSSGPALGRVVYASERGVFVRDLASGAEERRAGLPSETLDAWPSPDGHWLAYLRRAGDLWLLDLDSNLRWRISERLSTGLGWSPDRRLVAGELLADRDLVAIDPERRGTDLLVSGYTGGRMVWRDDDEFFTAIGDDTVRIRTSEQRPTVRKVVDDAWPLAISPDGKQLLYAASPEGSKPMLVVGDLEGDELSAKRTAFRGIVYRAAVSRQGFVAFSGREPSNAGGTWVLESAGRRPRRVSRQQAETISWSLDGSAVLYSIDGALYARDLREDRTVRLSRRGHYVKAFAVVP